MQIATITVGAGTASTDGFHPIPAGLIGGTVKLEFTDPVWNGLVKTAVFRSTVTKDVVNVSDEVTIPWETVSTPGTFLWMGVYGTNGDGTLVIPTLWCQIGPVRPAAAPTGSTPESPTPEFWQQLAAQIGSLRDLQTAAKENLVAAINEAATTGSAGSSSAYTLLGKTPQRISGGTVRLAVQGESSYTVQSDTVAEMDISSASPTKATLVEKDGYYQLQAADGVANWYQSYVDLTTEGLTQGEEYTFLFDAAGVPYDAGSGVTVGHFILYDGNGSTLVTRNALQGAVLHSYSFTATTEGVRLRWYPAPSTEFQAGVSTANVSSIYINRAGTTAHTQILSLSGSFTDSVVLQELPAGVTVSAEPEADLYLKTGSEEQTVTRLSGKKCVCFGDSVTGNMDAPYDYPSVVAEQTGMETVNAGFGGCRMSDTHPTECYAAFSMVKLAEAVASGDWSLQESLAADMSESTHAAEHLQALKALDWEQVDIVTIAYGTNDIQGYVKIDNAEDPMDTSTYLGGLRYALTKLLTACPYLKVLLLTPIYRYWDDEGVDSDEKRFDGESFTAWGDGLLGVAEAYKIPAVDLYRTLGFNVLTRGYFFPENDGTHPNRAGQKRIGEKLAASLLAQY